MNGFKRHEVQRPIFAVLLFACFALFAYPQSQALDGQIEGIVTDANGSILTKAAITAINVETGAKRTSSVNDEGIFRFPYLSLGVYTLAVESPGFKRFEHRGIILSAGQTTSVTISLEAGRAEELVMVTSDAPIADASKVEIGRVVNSRDVNNLPLVSRNPYNYMLLQPGVAGRTVKDPSVVDLSANGLRRRVGYHIDGNYDNEANLGGFRLNLISPIYVREVQLLSNGYSAEFGNTAGAVVNVITPSGTNVLDGAVTILFRPAGLSSKPFGFKTGTTSNIDGYGGIVTIGGPIIRDRWHFYMGYEWLRRNTATPITITDANQADLISAGLPARIFVNDRPLGDTLPFLIFRADGKVSAKTRINFRYNRFDADQKYGGIGGLSTTQRSFSLAGYDHALAAQAVTTFSETFFNEFRFQYAKRIARTVSNDLSVTGPSVTINGIANFGPNPSLGQIGTYESAIQFQNAVTKVFKTHSIKLGGGIIFTHDRPRSAIASTYTFDSVDKYSAAVAAPVNGIERKGYTTYIETFGDSLTDYRSTFLHFFVQDEWLLSRRAKLSIGLRYELYLPPAADAGSPLASSRKFNVDVNNFAPRLGLAYLLRDGKYRTVVRIGAGLHYDPPLLTMYKRAIQNNGNPRFYSVSYQAGGSGPAFPNRLGSVPSGPTIKPDVDAVAADFKTMSAVHSNVQVEQALADNISLTIGYIYSNARHIPVYRNINCQPIGGTLADGRPLYGTQGTQGTPAVSCTRPVFSQFNVVKIAESAGNLSYHAVFVQATKRFSSGFQLGASYTYSRARDDAPEEIGPGQLTQSDPSNRALDRGIAYGDVTNTFSMSLVARPSFKLANRFFNTLLNNNQISFIALADSGENFNITTADINRDGVSGPDRPVGVPRNSGRLPAYFGLDARYSRFLKLNEKMSIEFYAEGTNILNAKQVSSYNSTVLTANNSSNSQVNPLTGELLRPLPDFRNLSTTWRDSRQIQLGVRIHF